MLFSIFAGAAFYFFENCCRYVAYGEVVGRKIELSPPCDGVVSALHVRVGDVLRQGDPVFNIDSIEMRHRMEQIQDSLNLERARLGSELARLKWEADRLEDTQQLVKADYYEKWSELLWEQSVLTDLTQQLRRAERLQQDGAVAPEKLQSLRHRVEGQEQRTEQLRVAVQSLKNSLENDRPIDPTLHDQLKPTLVHVENLQAELCRVRQLLDQGLVRCPTNGRVTRIMKYSGECVTNNASVVELYVDGSTEIVLYLPQARLNQWSVGDRMAVRIEPGNQDLDCLVSRLAPELQRAPESIKRHYSADELLMQIVVRPGDLKVAENLVLGSKVRLARSSASTMHHAVAWLRGSSGTASTGVELIARRPTDVRRRGQ